MVLVGFPLLSIIAGLIGYFLFKNIMISPLLVFLSTIVATYTVFNDSFLIWVFVYTSFAFLSGLIVKIYTEKKQAL